MMSSVADYHNIGIELGNPGWPREDDWSGITDRKERKKRQNRINQRTFRERYHHTLSKKSTDQ